MCFNFVAGSVFDLDGDGIESQAGIPGECLAADYGSIAREQAN